LQTFKYFLLATFPLLLLCNTILYSQEIPTKNKSVISAKEAKDTIAINKNSILPEFNETIIDTVKSDTIILKEEMLTGVINYFGEDYVYLDKLENKVYMYNKAYITYEDMRIEGGYIIIKMKFMLKELIALEFIPKHQYLLKHKMK
jgi:hypothetical protein